MAAGYFFTTSGANTETTKASIDGLARVNVWGYGIIFAT